MCFFPYILTFIKLIQNNSKSEKDNQQNKIESKIILSKKFQEGRIMDHPSGSTIPSIFRNASTTRSVQKSARSFDETSPSSPTSSSSGFTGKNNTLCLQFRNAMYWTILFFRSHIRSLSFVTNWARSYHYLFASKT